MKSLLACLCSSVLALCFLTGAAAQQVAFQRLEIDAAPPRNPWIKAVGDLDQDRYLDVIVSLMHQGQAPHEVTVYLNIEHGLRWEKQVISETGSHNIIAGDLNNDGAVDILGANHGGDYQPVEWWRNGGAAR